MQQQVTMEDNTESMNYSETICDLPQEVRPINVDTSIDECE